MARPSKIDYYLDMAETVEKRGTCLRRNYGAVIVNNDCIVSTGYSGSPRGMPNCIETEICQREEKGIPQGSNYELCQSVHAEMNAIIHASRDDMFEGTLYLFGRDAKTKEPIDAESCKMCKKMIINSGLEKVIAKNKDGSHTTSIVESWIHENFIFID
jgi:dCMP deaminase